MNSPQNPHQDTLFFDSQCPLCRKEIALLKKLQHGTLGFIDIHDQPEMPNLPSRQEMLKILHLQTADGIWLTALNATVKAWSHTSFGCLLQPLLWPIFQPFTNRCYKKWAERRFHKRYGCDTCRL